MTDSIEHKLTAVIDPVHYPTDKPAVVQPVVRKQHNDGYKHKVGSERVIYLYST